MVFNRQKTNLAWQLILANKAARSEKCKQRKLFAVHAVSNQSCRRILRVY